jgi:hypothetical protein
MRPAGFPETSVTKYQSALRNIPEERRSYNAPEVWKHLSLYCKWIITFKLKIMNNF